MALQRLFLSFDGRIDRLRCWIGMIAVEIVTTVIETLCGVPIADDPADLRTRLIAFVIGLVSLYPIAAIAAKRLHDRNQPAKWAGLLLAACLVDLVADLTGMLRDPSHLTFSGWIIGVFVAVIALGFLIELGFRRGTPGPNRFGPEPRGARA